MRKTADAAASETADDHAGSLREAGAEAARKDPAHALLLAQNFTSDQDKLEFLRGIYSVWSNTDPLAALEYAKTSLPAGLARSETIGIAVNKWSTRDPRAAWLWTEANLIGPLKEQAFTDVLIGWTRRSPEAAAQWLASTGSNSTPLLAAVAATWAEQDPRKPPNGPPTCHLPEQKSTNIPIAAEWANQAPKEAAEHFTPDISQPDGAALATTIAGIWGTTNPAATPHGSMNSPPAPEKRSRRHPRHRLGRQRHPSRRRMERKNRRWKHPPPDHHPHRHHMGSHRADGALNWLYSLPVNSPPTASPVPSTHGPPPMPPPSANGWTPPRLREMDQARLALAEVTSEPILSPPSI